MNTVECVDWWLVEIQFLFLGVSKIVTFAYDRNTLVRGAARSTSCARFNRGATENANVNNGRDSW